MAVIGAASERGLLYGSLPGCVRCRPAPTSPSWISARRAQVAWHAEPLGQPGPHRRARLRRTVDPGTGGALCPTCAAPATATTRAPMPRWASTAWCSTTSTTNPGAGQRLAAQGRRRCRERPYGQKGLPVGALLVAQGLGGLANSDPPARPVRAWWQAKVDEVTALIPDFGGFLVEANSEGQPGHDYGRSHAEGAADGRRAAPHLRRLVDLARLRLHSEPTRHHDRASRPTSSSLPWDGKFASNVVVQVKGGASASDRAGRFHPMFGAVPKTQLGMGSRSPRSTSALPRTWPTWGPCTRRCCAPTPSLARRHRPDHGGAHPSMAASTVTAASPYGRRGQWGASATGAARISIRPTGMCLATAWDPRAQEQRPSPRMGAVDLQRALQPA